MNTQKRQSKASKASGPKADKNIDFAFFCQQQTDRYNQTLFSLDPLFTPLETLRTLPLYQFERFSCAPSPILNCFLNRRRCDRDDKNFVNNRNNQNQKLDLKRVKYNPDGRFSCIATEDGSLYTFYSHDVNRNYTYYVDDNSQNRYITQILFPFNTNTSAFGWSDGTVTMHYDILKIDKDDERKYGTQNVQDIEVHSIFKTELNNSSGKNSVDQLINFQNGLGAICDSKLYKIDIKDKQFVSEEIKLDTKNKFRDICQIDDNIFLLAGDYLELYDSRVGNKPLASAIYSVQSNSYKFRQISLHNGKQMIAAAGDQDAKVFDIRNLQPKTDCALYQVQSNFDYSNGVKVMWHPRYHNWLVTANDLSIFNFYCTDYTNESNVGFEGVDITKINLEDQVDSIFYQPKKQGLKLISQGGIFGAHRSKSDAVQKDHFKQTIDFDIHPSGNQLISIGGDQELKVFTTQRFGNLGRDCYNNGDIQLLKSENKNNDNSNGQTQYTDWTFDQQQYQTEQQISKIKEKFDQCIKINDFTLMLDYSSTSQERYIIEEEKKVRQ